MGGLKNGLDTFRRQSCCAIKLPSHFIETCSTTFFRFREVFLSDVLATSESFETLVQDMCTMVKILAHSPLTPALGPFHKILLFSYSATKITNCYCNCITAYHPNTTVPQQTLSNSYPFKPNYQIANLFTTTSTSP